MGDGLVKEQFMEFFPNGKQEQWAKTHFPKENDRKSLYEQKSLLAAIVINFMIYFGYCNADTADGLPQP